MSLSLVLAAALCAAPKTDPKLVGPWLLGEIVFVTFNADGTATMDDEQVKWTADGKTLKVTNSEGATDTAGYKLEGETLTMSLAEVPLSLTRGKKGVQPKKPVKDGTDDPETMARVQAELEQRAAAARAQAQQPQAASDPLSRLLLSSAWCSFSYNKVSGASRQSRVQFSADGRWSTGSRAETYNSGPNGTVWGQTDTSGGGQWQVRGGQLWMSEKGGPLQPVPGFSLSQNSNGYPIIWADGREYSSCN